MLTAMRVHHFRSMTLTVRRMPLGRFIGMSALPERIADAARARAAAFAVGAPAQRSRPARRSTSRWRRPSATRRRRRRGSRSAGGCTPTRPPSWRRWPSAATPTLSRFGGAATGVGGIVTLIPDLAAAAWIQSRMVFFIAAAYGYDPLRPDAPGGAAGDPRALPDPAEARRALDGAGKMVAEAYVGSRLQREEALAARLARFAGRRAGAPLRRPPDPVRGDRLQRDRQRARDARARGQDDQVLRGLDRDGSGSAPLSRYGRAVTSRATAAAGRAAADSSRAQEQDQPAISAGGTSRRRAPGIDSRFAGVSISDGETTLQRTPSSCRDRAGERDDGRLRRGVARRAGERLARGRRGGADDRAVARRGGGSRAWQTT